MMTGLKIEQVRRSVSAADGTSVEILGGVDMFLGFGRIAAVLGPNAIGKSTLARIVVGLDAPDHGHVQAVPCGGVRAMVHQEVDETLLPWRTNLRNIAFSLEALGSAPASASDQCAALIHRFDLPVPLDKRPGTSSGGIRQLVTLVRALAVRPRLLVLDEPFSRIDVTLIATLRHLVRTCVTEVSAACMLVTHNFDDALILADDIYVLWKQGGEGARVHAHIPVAVAAQRDRQWLRSEECAEYRRRLQNAFDEATL